ncbi:MAG: HPF/RaiA family ribosome-associated protein [Phycisphaerales bacterium]
MEAELTVQIQINYADIDSSDALGLHVTETVEKALKLHVERVTRVEVHLHDDKLRRRGPADKRCTMEARLAGEKPLAVEAREGDIYKAVAEAAGKLARAVEHLVDRHQRH